MKSRIARIAQGIMEAGWLAALIVAPLYFNVQTERVFEPDKISLVRWLAVVVVSAWVVWAVETGGQLRQATESWQEALRRFVRIPLVAPTLLVILSYLLSTALSVTPRISFFGSYQRLQGTWTTFSYIALFFVALQQLRRREQLERLITVVVVTSLPIALYGILQHYGRDPLPWVGNVRERVTGNMGNAIFIGAYLIMVIFLTTYRVIRSFAGILADEEGARGYTDALLGGFYLFILAVQVITLVFTQSRGPFLGFLAGAYLFALLALLALRPRYYRALTGGLVGLAVLGAAFLVVFNLPTSPLEPLKEVRYVGRLGKILDVSRRNPTGRVRVLIWQGVVELILPHEPLQFPPDMRPDPMNPLRPLIGYGPESMWVAYNRFYQPELGQIERRNASPDRSHNETFDSLVRTGLLGFGAYVWVFLSVFYFVLKWLGLIRTGRDRALFLGFWFGAGMLSALLARLLDGGWRFFGVSLPFGFVVGLVLYVTLVGLTRELPEAARADRERYLILLALLASIAAHYVEINFGIAIVATRTYFWLLAAVLVVLGTERLSLKTAPAPQPVSPPPPPPSSRRSRRRRRRDRRATRAAPPPPRPSLLRDPTLWAYMGLLALIFATLTYEFVINLSAGQRVADRVGQILANSMFSRVQGNVRVSNPHQFFLLLFTWGVAGVILTGEVTRRHGLLRPGTWLRGFSLQTLGAWTAFWVMGLVQASFHSKAARLQVTASRDPQLVQTLASHLAWFPVGYYVFLILSVAAVGLVLALEGGWPQMWARREVAVGAAALALALSLYVGFGPSLRPIWANTYFKQAQAFAQARRYAEAEALYREAISLAPKEDYYYLFLGKALLEHASLAQDLPTRERLLNDAEKVLTEARDLNPLNTDHTANLARYYVARAGISQNPEERRKYLEEALRYFAQAISLSPNNARLRDEYAVALLQVGREQEALEQLHHALALDDSYYLTYTYLGDYYRNKEQWDEAERYYLEALRRHRRDVQILSGLAYVYARKGDLNQAIEYNRRVLERRPQDLATLRNLALLYYQVGKPGQALTYARQALEVAPPQEKPALDALVKQIEQGAKASP